ncbi:pyridoxamine 5'-phosphate oxidase family protein [Kineosporia sp. J2-2]|uniref:Pyridoxamine 5'-phosphate oxidase family protein n=1 Tax=Kineosporia corallincola TaxID=2835133 RepID=A0ABS5TFL4_9ACTN|nr:pyridoxamine 5'-phosphate oxidase family protein [Kineosporia corallincola]MBT0768399.1 pyridoxamine 5'-phosphate oxidase family protein [Kineosporia corallincola]
MIVEGEAWELLSGWLPRDDDPERPQMQLATVDAGGLPDVRTVLLSGFSPEGLRFHTDAGSRKAGHLSAHPPVALLLLWPGFTRQLSVQGVAEVSAAEEIEAAYRARSPYLRQLAWHNTHELAQLDEPGRVAAWSAWSQNPVPSTAPPGWTGYLVRPRRLTFWQSHPATASRRTEFTATPGGWRRSYLPG